MKKALITGITGQDGSYLAEFLLKKGYEVHGLVRRVSVDTLGRIQHLRDQLILHHADLMDQFSITKVIKEVQPDEIYHLGAMSFVGTSWRQPVLTGEVTGMGAGRILEAIRYENPKVKFYQASSSEMFGVAMPPQREETKFHPRSPYGVAKVYAHHMVVNYRESFDLFACSGILFNHESERRGLEFVTRKISHAAAMIKLGAQEVLELGNLHAKRDWGHAEDYVRAMWLMLQQEKPDDFVIATGETHSVKEFVDEAFKKVAMPLIWEGEGINEVGKFQGKVIVRINPKYIRPAEVDHLCGDYSKAKKILNWEPTIKFSQLVERMVLADLENVKRELAYHRN